MQAISLVMMTDRWSLFDILTKSLVTPEKKL